MSSGLITAADIRGERDERWPEDEFEAEALEVERARATVRPVRADDVDPQFGLHVSGESTFERERDAVPAGEPHE